MDLIDRRSGIACMELTIGFSGHSHGVHWGFERYLYKLYTVVGLLRIEIIISSCVLPIE